MKYYLIITSRGPVEKLGPFKTQEERNDILDTIAIPSNKTVERYFTAETNDEGELSIFGPIVSS